MEGSTGAGPAGRARVMVALALLFLAGSYVMLAAGDAFIADVVRSEFGVVENLGALALLAAATLAALALVAASRSDPAARFPRLLRLFLLGLALAMLLAGGEELSWGQHWLGFGTPEGLAEDNRQGETNLHNLELFQGFALTPDRLYFLFGAAFLVGVPLLAALGPAVRERLVRVVPLVPRALAYLFVANYAFSKVATVIAADRYRQPIKEIQEMNIALLMAAGSYFALRYVRGRAGAPAPARAQGAITLS